MFCPNFKVRNSLLDMPDLFKEIRCAFRREWLILTGNHGISGNSWSAVDFRSIICTSFSAHSMDDFSKVNTMHLGSGKNYGPFRQALAWAERADAVIEVKAADARRRVSTGGIESMVFREIDCLGAPLRYEGYCDGGGGVDFRCSRV